MYILLFMTDISLIFMDLAGEVLWKTVNNSLLTEEQFSGDNNVIVWMNDFC